MDRNRWNLLFALVVPQAVPLGKCSSSGTSALAPRLWSHRGPVGVRSAVAAMPSLRVSTARCSPLHAQVVIHVSRGTTR
jgi:hypothetical protein